MIPDRLTNALTGRYRLDRELGAGGMATVYLAHDLRHERDVAIKVLHQDLGAALGSERFLSEIRTTARLQHSHILPLLDSGEADGLLYYVMPVVAGESLRERIQRERQLPIPEAVRIAREVAGALDYAHRQGVIHRDIKPENILLHDGQALVADFGIALAVQSAGRQRMTQTGLSLGTPQYMSPEQAMGEKTLDARTDIYALGAVTYEMLVGDPPFTGSSAQAIVAKVLAERPTPPRMVRDTIPPGVEEAVLTALAKLPADRFATAAEFGAALALAGTAAFPRAIGPLPPRGLRGNRPALLLGGAALAALALAAWGWLRPDAAPLRVTRVAVAIPPDQAMQPQSSGFGLDLSRDGTRLAYVGVGPTAGSVQAWIRPLDALDGVPVPGTVGAHTVRWSPNGRALYLGFPPNPAASVVPLDGGQPVSLSSAGDGTWGALGRVYSIRGGYLLRQAPGGALDSVVRLDTAFTQHTLTVLPDEEAALFPRRLRAAGDTAAAQLVGVRFRTGQVTVIGPGVFAQYLPPGHLLHVAANGDAFVAPFDPKALRITGPGLPVARVAMGLFIGGRAYPQISVSEDGTLAYLSGELQRERLLWLDARGRAQQPLDIEGHLWGISLSPDGSEVAFSMERSAPGENSVRTADVWVERLATGVRTRLTSSLWNIHPTWSADGKSVLFVRQGGPERLGLFERRADAGEPERLVLSQQAFGHSIADGRWLPDHRTLLVTTYGERDGGRNIYAIAPGADTAAHPVAVSAGNEASPRPSPDGALVAYTSDETGTRELYVQAFPSRGGRLRVSNGGASGGRWSRDGRQLYFWDQRGTLMAAAIEVRPALALAGLREVGGDITLAAGSDQSEALFDLAPDGRVMAAQSVAGSLQLILVRNWMAGLAGGARP